MNAVCQKPEPPRRLTAAERLARKPNWKQAEDYMRRHRDRKVRVTLPRVRLPEPVDDR
jgi:hypothetical protein